MEAKRRRILSPSSGRDNDKVSLHGKDNDELPSSTNENGKLHGAEKDNDDTLHGVEMDVDDEKDQEENPQYEESINSLSQSTLELNNSIGPYPKGRADELAADEEQSQQNGHEETHDET